MDQGHAEVIQPVPPTAVLVLFCLLLPFGVWGVLEAAGAAADFRKVEVWGTVLQSRIRKDEQLSRKLPCLTEWLVEYRAGGETYQGWFVVQARANELDAAEGDGIGKAQPVWYDPEAPDHATTNPPNPGGQALVACAYLFMGLGGLGSTYVLLRRRIRCCT